MLFLAVPWDRVEYDTITISYVSATKQVLEERLRGRTEREMKSKLLDNSEENRLIKLIDESGFFTMKDPVAFGDQRNQLASSDCHYFLDISLSGQEHSISFWSTHNLDVPENLTTLLNAVKDLAAGGAQLEEELLRSTRDTTPAQGQHLIDRFVIAQRQQLTNRQKLKILEEGIEELERFSGDLNKGDIVNLRQILEQEVKKQQLSGQVDQDQIKSIEDKLLEIKTDELRKQAREHDRRVDELRKRKRLD